MENNEEPNREREPISLARQSVSEIGGLRLANVCLAGALPHMRIRGSVAKGGQPRFRAMLEE